MSEMKLSSLDKRIAQFAASTTELLTGIEARNKAGSKGASNKKRRMKKTTSKPKPDIKLPHKKASGS